MPLLTPENVRGFRPLDEMVPDHWRSETTTAADGTTLHWTDTGGDGAPIVLLHGVQIDGLAWLRTARALEPRHRVVMPDLRGHGRSGRVDAPLSADVHVADVRAVLAAAGVTRPTIVGHSLGADVAGFLAAVDADVQRVVLVDPALRDMTAAMGGFDVDAPPPWMQSLFDTLRALPDMTHDERMVAGLKLMPPGPPPDWHEADYVSLVTGQARFDLGVYRHVVTDVPQLGASPDAIAAITCPIVLLTATQMLPGADIDTDVTAFTEHWRDGRHIHFPDSGHWIAADQFERFLEIVSGSRGGEAETRVD